jgi:diguanylate cyclase (GGDEF)-like protein
MAGKTPLKILLIEDSESDAFLQVRELTQSGYAVTFERVAGAETLDKALKRGGWDLIISDFTMPGFSGQAALEKVRQYDAELPFIFVSGTMGEDEVVAALRVGADDYVLKDNLKRLVPSVERALRDASARRDRKRAEARVIHLAYHDSLTDLPNRSLFHDRLEQAVASARRTQESVALLVMDLDGFKPINDSLGHYAGDLVLQQVASRLHGVLREADTLARIGGDEFAFVLPHTDGEGATVAAEKIVRVLKRPILVDRVSLVVTGSVGIACFPEHGSTAETLLHKADIAMYAAKTDKLEFAIYTAERDYRAHSRLTALTELQEGIDRNQFFFEYQPIVDLKSRAIAGVEALARWQHPRQGIVPPETFMDLAEQTSLVRPFTMYLLEKALMDWKNYFSPLAIPVAVNLSYRNLQDLELPGRTGDLLRRLGIAPSMLQLEITENFVMSDPSRASHYLERLHDMGVRLAIDDFGTGYSSLGYLRQLPVDALKIDRSFVAGVTQGDDLVARCVINLAHNLGFSAVAEGVESEAILDRLHELGCDTAQGFYFARPSIPCETVRWIEQHRPYSERDSAAGF